MSNEALLSNIIRFAGSGFGYAMGFALKKILKWTLIILGFLAGMFFVGWLYSYVSADSNPIPWTKTMLILVTFVMCLLFL